MHIAKLQVLLEHSEVPGHFNLSHRTSTVYTERSSTGAPQISMIMAIST